jgi:hypothetical protein
VGKGGGGIDAPIKLAALAQASIDALPGVPGSRQWADAFRAVLTRAHTAAYMAGIAERTGVAPRGLSAAERADVKAAVKAQLEYLDGFIQELSGLSEAQIGARADLYAGAVKASFYGARFPGLPGYPCDGGTPCLGRCKCHLESRDGGIYWVLGAAESCDGCTARAAGSPYGG